MNFNKIDIENWQRKNVFNHFFYDVPCTYSMTVNLDITRLLAGVHKRDLKIFPVILYGMSYVVNRHSEFRMDFDEEKRPGFYDYCNPSYTVFHGENEMFTNVWTQYDENFKRFYDNYSSDMRKYKRDDVNSKPAIKNIFNVSCIPWTSFTGFNLNLKYGYDYLLPIFTVGKYFRQNKQLLLPLAIQVHHAVCDGYHAAIFINELQQWADDFKGD
ncbi:MAG TPA: type A chloramphenicol O-acetyltransferase [Candidatus Megamonas gallistercoris]|nr:type A chloramphenicol O-acetyltransferase [Candidatus Megamonas gallistercoris]